MPARLTSATALLVLAIVACGESPPGHLVPSPEAVDLRGRRSARDTAPSLEVEAAVLRRLTPVASRLLRRDWGIPDSTTEWGLDEGLAWPAVVRPATPDPAPSARARAREALYRALADEMRPTVRPDAPRTPPQWRGVAVDMRAHGDTVVAIDSSISGRACGDPSDGLHAMYGVLDRQHWTMLVRDVRGRWEIAGGPLPLNETGRWWNGDSMRHCQPVPRDSTFHQRVRVSSEVAR